MSKAINLTLSAIIIAAMVFAFASCSDGGHFIEGPQGKQGPAGTDGTNGLDGKDGSDGQDAILEVIDPCGDNPGKFDELIFRLADGTLMAYFEDGGKRFLTLLLPDNYRTTDAQKCDFIVTEDLEVIW